MSILWIDFETRSRCNLLTAGAYNYSLDASTEVLCMSYAFDDDGTRAEKRSERTVAIWLLLGGVMGLLLLLVFLFWPWEYKP